MSAALMDNQVGRILWKLRECMARRKVTNNALAKEMGTHVVTISRLRSQDLLPEIGSDRIEQIRVAIERLSSDKYGPCPLEELVALSND